MVGRGLGIGSDGVLFSNASTCLDGEVCIGRWYNKPLYRTRILLTIGKNGGWGNTVIDSNHVPVSWEGQVDSTNSWRYTFNWFSGSGNYGVLVWDSTSRLFKTLTISSDLNTYGTLTYLYTKTSDPELT